MKIVLVDSNWKTFLPVSFTRPVSHLRCGILKLYEKWEKHLELVSVSVSEGYLNTKFFKEFDGGALIINSKVLPNKELVEAISELKPSEMLTSNGKWIAIKSDVGFNKKSWEGVIPQLFKGEVKTIENWWDLYKVNGEEIENDFDLITKGRISQSLSSSNTLIGSLDRLFIEKGSYIEACTLNTQNGSIYIGNAVEVMEGCSIRGGFSVLDHSKIKLGSKIYGPTSIGPKCRVGGEVKNSIFQGYSNKSHDGYLGNSIIGEWVNLGADTNCSNLKNTFSEAKVWDYEKKSFQLSGEQFIGCCIGDFSKTGINTMLNTASVIGVNSNVFGVGFPAKKVPSFSWGAAETYNLNKAWAVNQNIAKMANEELTAFDFEILKSIQEIDL